MEGLEEEKSRKEEDAMVVIGKGGIQGRGPKQKRARASGDGLRMHRLNGVIGGKAKL